MYNALGEKEKRFEIFKSNLRFIDEHNSVDRTYRVGLNRFADLTNEEYRSNYLGVKPGETRRRLSAPRKSDRYVPVAGEELPDSLDWRAKGAVVGVKDQGSCGNWLIYPLVDLNYFLKLLFFIYNDFGNCNILRYIYYRQILRIKRYNC